VEMPVARTAGKLLDEVAAREPTKTAIICGDVSLSYGELNEQVNRGARSLLALGAGRGDHVAVLIGNRPEWVVMYFATARIGAVLVPLNTWYRRSELEWTLRHTNAKLLVYIDKFLGHDYVDELSGIIPQSDALVGESASPRRAGAIVLDSSQPPASALDDFFTIGRDVSDERLAAAVDAVTPDDVHCILYTSGSTADPKGVPLRQGGIVENGFGIGERRGLVPSDRVWLGSPLFYALGAVNALPATVTHGATLIVQGHFTAASAIDTIERDQATMFYGTSNMIRAIRDDPSYAPKRLSSLRGGAAGISGEERRILIEEFGATGATPSYGSTETYGNAAGGSKMTQSEANAATSSNTSDWS